MTEGELFYDYVIEAFDAFVSNHSDLTPRYDVSFESEVIETKLHSVYCNVKVEDGETSFLISVALKTIDAVKYGLDLNKEEDRFLYKMRVYWIVHHEIGHWVWGHIPFYEERGWTTKLGMFEAHSEHEIANVQTHIDTELTYTAELLADSFATIELFNFISREDDGDEYDRFVTANLLIYAVMTTVALFYKERSDQRHSLFHPPWRLRTINILAIIFECFLIDCFGENRIRAGMRITAAVVNPHLKDFIDNSLLPAWEGAAAFAESNALEGTTFSFDEKGIISPQKMLAMMTRNEDSYSDVRQLLQLYEKSKFWVQQSNIYSPLNNFEPGYVFGERKSTDLTQFDCKVSTHLSQETAASKIEIWAKNNDFRILNVDFNSMPDKASTPLILDVHFQSMTSKSTNWIRLKIEELQNEIR